MIQITKESGEIVPFDPEKLRRSLKRVGTEDNLVNQIVDEVTVHPLKISMPRKHSVLQQCQKLCMLIS